MFEFIKRQWKKFLILIGLTTAICWGAELLPSIPDIAFEKMAIAYDNASQIKAKYKMENASFIMEAIDENAMQTEIGDKTADKFTPEMTLRKWDNEVNFKIKYKHNEKEKDLKFELDGEKIKLKGKKIETHFYEMENENYEFEIILLEKPDTNIVSFDIETQGLDFFYQPELTQKEKDEGALRPENVVGSYAVYHESKQGDYSKMGLKNYRAGKAFHIYRPKIIDSAGTEVWGELNITDNLLTVEIPQEFLDNAIYPVIVDPTFGYTSEAGTLLVNFANYAKLIKGTPINGDGTVDNIKVSAKKHTGYAGVNYQVKPVIWLVSDSTIITNGISPLISINIDSRQWWTSTYSTSPSVTNNIDYYIGVVTNGNNSTDEYYDTGSSGDGGISSNNYASPTNLGGIIWTDHKFSIYATYTAGEAEEDTCTYSGTGDWDVLYSDNCYVTTTTYVLGDFNLIYDGAGSFNLQTILKCDNLNVGAGATISAENSTAQIEIY